MPNLSRPLLMLLVAGLVACTAPRSGGDEMALATSAVPLNTEAAGETALGKLSYLAGLEIKSPDPRFGGYSGLVLVDGGRRLLALSDLGHWLSATIERDAQGRLRNLTNGRFAAMLDDKGQPLTAKEDSDAESLRPDGRGNLVVGFERRHRVLSYKLNADGLPFGSPGLPVAPPADPAFAAQPENGSLESLAVLPDGRWLLISEDGRDANGGARVWLRRADGSAWDVASYQTTGIFQPTDAVALPNGDVLVLERRFTVVGGVGARLARVRAADIRPGHRMVGEELANWAPPRAVDNMEGMAVETDAQGRTIVWLISDDNQNPVQRTLLLQFRLD